MSDQPVTPRLSATILLVRDNPGLQVFMAKRHHQIDFASGALVFPGGKASDDDLRAEWAARTDGDLGDLTAAGICAVRETFEESGLLMCRSEDARGIDAPLVGADVAERLAPMRAAVDKGEQSFLDLLAEHGLVVALDRLEHFGHWITPEFMPKRFDTHFFLARVPSGQIAVHDGRETTDSLWIAPGDALSEEADGRATILFPTRLNLEILTDCTTAGEATSFAEAFDVVTVTPVIIRNDAGEKCLSIPDNSGYRTLVQPLAKEQANATRGAKKA